jgi:hypothetical protein
LIHYLLILKLQKFRFSIAVYGLLNIFIEMDCITPHFLNFSEWTDQACHLIESRQADLTENLLEFAQILCSLLIVFTSLGIIGWLKQMSISNEVLEDGLMLKEQLNNVGHFGGELWDVFWSRKLLKLSINVRAVLQGKRARMRMHNQFQRTYLVTELAGQSQPHHDSLLSFNFYRHAVSKQLSPHID